MKQNYWFSTVIGIIEFSAVCRPCNRFVIDSEVDFYNQISELITKSIARSILKLIIIEHSSIVLSVTEGMAREATVFYKRQASCLAAKSVPATMPNYLLPQGGLALASVTQSSP